MLSEYVTHIVRSIVACNIMSPRNLAEIMQIDGDCFDRLFGRPAVSDELQLQHLEALTRFFGCRMYDTGFLLTLGYTPAPRGWSNSSRRSGESQLEQLSKTADRMLLGGNEDYGRSSTCSASAMAESRGYAEMAERCSAMAFIVGMDDGSQEAEQTEDKLEEAVA